MLRTHPTLKPCTILGSILLATALLVGTGCGESEDDCIGAGCLSPVPDSTDVPCDLVCSHLLEQCEQPPLKLARDEPMNLDGCVMLCEKGLDADERACLAEIGCDEAPACLDE
jgi:hypothetical protein